MEKRRSRRIVVKLDAERISGDTAHAVYIENISEDGICITSAPAQDAARFTPDVLVILKLRLSSGQTIDLHCRVIWSFKTQPRDKTRSTGLEVIDPPPEYTEFVKTLPQP
jgi:hypothetical protein